MPGSGASHRVHGPAGLLRTAQLQPGTLKAKAGHVLLMDEQKRQRDTLHFHPSLALRVTNLLAFLVLIGVKLAAKAGFLVERPTAAVKSPLAPARYCVVPLTSEERPAEAC